MQTAAGVWAKCRLETNPLCWCHTVGRGWETTFHSDRFQCTADIKSNVICIYFLVWSLSRLLCCVGSGSDVAAAVLSLRLSDTHAPFCSLPPSCLSLQITNDIIIITSHPALCVEHLISFVEINQPEQHCLNLKQFL